ncbi:MAG TPA: hypothetical protein VFY06_06130 [Verrucomicrobiae bacterium]|nr:hypothetical protein [Verrucomicrobiae bacterium]
MKWTRCFIYSAGAILLAGALARFLIFGNHDVPALSLPDPVVGIPLHYAVLIVGLFELVVAVICLFGRRIWLQVGAMGVLATGYVLFWTGLHAKQCQLQGTCLGSLTDPLRLTHGPVEFVTAYLPLYLVVGSYAALAWVLIEHFRGSRTNAVASS